MLLVLTDRTDRRPNVRVMVKLLWMYLWGRHSLRDTHLSVSQG